MPPKPTPAPSPPTVNVEPYLRDASPNAREDEVGDGPEGNWEVAYVYAFIDRFTDLRKVEYGSPLKSVFDLEQALLASSPPSKVQRKAVSNAANNTNGIDQNENGNHETSTPSSTSNGNPRPHSSASSLSSLSDDEDTPVAQPMPANPSISAVPPLLPADAPMPPPSDTLVAIIECFKANLAGVPEINDYHGRKTWLTWLINFVGKRLQDKFFGGFRWESNLLRTRGLKPGQEEDKMFWYLRWEDKVHLFRQLVDFQLANSPVIREKVQQGYDLGHQRNALRTQNVNPLIVEPLGTTLTKRQVFHIDESARLYASSAIPAKSTSTIPPPASNWATMTSTTPGYKAFLLSLPEPAPPPGSVPGKPGPKKSKGPKPGSKEDPKREERLIRTKLERGLEKLAKFDEAIAEVAVKQRRVAARRADADARLARNLSRSVNTSSRSTRQQQRAIDYSNDGHGYTRGGGGGGGEGEDEEIDELEEDVEEDQASRNHSYMGGGRSKRRKVGTTTTAGDDWDTSSIASDSTTGRPSLRRNGSHQGKPSSRRIAPVIPGERRSSRVQSKLKEEGYDVGSDEVDELDDESSIRIKEEEMDHPVVVEQKETNGTADVLESEHDDGHVTENDQKETALIEEATHVVNDKEEAQESMDVEA